MIHHTVYPPNPATSFNRWIRYIHLTARKGAGHLPPDEFLLYMHQEELAEVEHEIKTILK